jgi:FkbM family methyltransferase
MKIKIVSKILRKIKKILYISRSKKISKLLRNILGKKKIYIVDIGAGHRFLPTLLNFDGVSKIAMIDPNDNLNLSYNNFIKILNYPQNVTKFLFGISNKTEKIKYFKTKISTGSTVVDIYKNAKKNKIKLDKKYFGEKKLSSIQVYSYDDFKTNFFNKIPDVVKIDVEGFELEVLESLLKKNTPTVIEIEVNINHPLYPNTFTKINNLLVGKKYKMSTGFMVYRNSSKNLSNNNPYTCGDYENPKFRSPSEQMDCIYINENIKTEKAVCILIGYGLQAEAKKLFDKISKKIPKDNFVKLNTFFKKECKL